jgi:ParB family chromosome partitioning protein
MDHKKLTVSHLPPASLHPNPWNPNVVDDENMRRLEASFDRFGIFKPVLIRTLENGDKQIIGGQHRNLIAIARGLESVPVIDLGVLSDTTAQEIGLVDNQRYGEDDTLRLGALLGELGDLSALAGFMPYSDLELQGILASTQIDLDTLDIDDDAAHTRLSAQAPASHQIMRFKIPKGDAHVVSDAIEAVISAQGYTGSDSLTNAGDALVYLLRNPTQG